MGSRPPTTDSGADTRARAGVCAHARVCTVCTCLARLLTPRTPVFLFDVAANALPTTRILPTAATPRRQADDTYAPDADIQGARAAAAGSVYVDTPLTRARSDAPGGSSATSVYAATPLTRATADAPGDRNAASFYAATPLTTAAADEAGYEVAREDDAVVVLDGYEVPVDDDAAPVYAMPSNSTSRAQVHPRAITNLSSARLMTYACQKQVT